MNFSNKLILQTFSSSDSKNVWANIQSIGWRKVAQNSVDGATNMAIIINTAKAHNLPVTGNINASSQITYLFF